MLKRSISTKKAKKPYLRELRGNRFWGVRCTLKSRSLCTQREGGGSGGVVRGMDEVDEGAQFAQRRAVYLIHHPLLTSTL